MLSESFEPAVASRDAAGSEDGYAHTIKGTSQTGKIQGASGIALSRND